MGRNDAQVLGILASVPERVFGGLFYGLAMEAR